MSEDRLEKALEAIKSEQTSPEQLAGAQARVWEKLGHPVQAACLEFRSEFHDFLAERLAGNRRLLVEDHISRCTQCRTLLAEMTGKRQVVPMPQRRASWWPRWGTWAAAAALVVTVLYAGRGRMDALLAPGGPRATVATLSGSLNRIPEGAMQAGAAIAEGEVIRTGPGAHAVLRLADGSMIEVNERTELFFRAAWSGKTVHLQRGDIIVQAAQQRRGHLRVITRDSIAAVKGTVFAVSAGLSGTLVSVVEGSVAVTQPGVDVLLQAGEQAASNPASADSMQDTLSWSSAVDTYLAQLAAIATVEKQLAQLPSDPLRTLPRLLPYMPGGLLVYGAIPNFGATLEQALALLEPQAAGNPIFQQWWDSGDGVKLKEIITRIQAVTPLLGSEIVFAFSTGDPGARQNIPMIAAEVQPGKKTALESAIESLSRQEAGTILPCSISDTLMILSDSQEHLQWLHSHAGQGIGTPFASAIADRYQQGVGMLVAMNLESISSAASNADPAASSILGAHQMKYLMLQRRGFQGADENEATLTFKGPRMGMASWLADSGSGGAAEYISSDAVFAAYGTTREPKQLFEELVAQLAKVDPSFQSKLAAAEAKAGLRFAEDLAAACGTEFALGLEGLSLSGPVWEMAVLVNDPLTIGNSMRQLVAVANAELAPSDPAKQITLEQETVDGHSWTTLKTSMAVLSITWTFDHGYLVAASDRAAALRAIATRNGGAPLIWSPAFQGQLPSSSGLHPSAFAWLNTKGALQGFSSLVSNAAIQQLINERDPILVVWNGTSEQIHVASRTRISGLIMDIMLLESLSSIRTGSLDSVLR
jgi:hypothetical protein